MDSRLLGIYGELAAARYLRRRGYKILETNFRSRYGEIDLIASQGETIIFVEVKTRDIATIGRPSEAVTFAKQRKIKSTALFYLSKFNSEVNVRFDVIELLADQINSKLKINHICGAFE